MGLQGSAIATRSDLNKQFYGREITAFEILSGGVDQPAAATCLYNAIQKAFSMQERENNMGSMPAAAEGTEVQILFEKVITLVGGMVGASAVEDFKQKCKGYGQGEIASTDFLSYLRVQFTTTQLTQLVPDLVRLLPGQEKRRDLWDFHAQIRQEGKLLYLSILEIS